MLPKAPVDQNYLYPSDLWNHPLGSGSDSAPFDVLRLNDWDLVGPVSRGIQIHRWKSTGSKSGGHPGKKSADIFFTEFGG